MPNFQYCSWFQQPTRQLKGNHCNEHTASDSIPKNLSHFLYCGESKRHLFHHFLNPIWYAHVKYLKKSILFGYYLTTYLWLSRLINQEAQMPATGILSETVFKVLQSLSLGGIMVFQESFSLQSSLEDKRVNEKENWHQIIQLKHKTCYPEKVSAFQNSYCCLCWNDKQLIFRSCQWERFLFSDYQVTLSKLMYV